jgi:hypothetical protein
MKDLNLFQYLKDNSNKLQVHHKSQEALVVVSQQNKTELFWFKNKIGL